MIRAHTRRLKIIARVYYMIGIFVVLLTFGLLSSTAHLVYAFHQSEDGVARTYVEKQKVVAVVPAKFPPQYSIDKFGNLDGFAIEVMDEVANIADIDVEYLIKDTWAETLDTLYAGEGDIIPNVGITPEREEKMNFTVPMEVFVVALFVRAENEQISSVDDLVGKDVAVVSGNVAVRLLADSGAFLQIFDHPEDAIFHVLSGNVDALVYPKPVVEKLLQDAGISNFLQVVGEPIVEVKRAIGVQKSKSELFEQLDDALQQFLQTEEYQKVYQKWYGHEMPFWTVEKVTFLATVLIVLITAGMFAWRFVSLKKVNRQLVQFAKHAVGREEKMIELKKELNKKKKSVQK